MMFWFAEFVVYGANEIDGNQFCSLVKKLEERMLSVCTGLAPDNWSCL